VKFLKWSVFGCEMQGESLWLGQIINMYEKEQKTKY
jgi:hypothetical protein